MHIVETGRWTLELDDDGTVIGLLRRPDDASAYAGRRHVELMIQTLNDDRGMGVAPPDVATWGYEYRNVFRASTGEFAWLSYLSVTWDSIADAAISSQDRLRVIADLRGVVADLLTSGAPPDRLRM